MTRRFLGRRKDDKDSNLVDHHLLRDLSGVVFGLEVFLFCPLYYLVLQLRT